jgi:hypothetical protein
MRPPNCPRGNRSARAFSPQPHVNQDRGGLLAALAATVAMRHP